MRFLEEGLNAIRGAVVFFGEVEALDRGFEVFLFEVAGGFGEEAEEGLRV